MKFHERESVKYLLEAEYLDRCYKAAKRKVARLQLPGGAEAQTEGYWRLRLAANRLRSQAIYARSGAEKLG